MPGTSLSSSVSAAGVSVSRRTRLSWAVRAKINADVAKVLTDAAVKARFDTFAFEPIAWSAEEIGRNAEAKSKVYEQLVRETNISLE